MYLRINGDDYGMTESCSRAIAEALARGLITHATVMATGEWFDEAAALAAESGFCDRLGIHFNLTQGRPLTRDICGVKAFVRDGCFHKDYLRQPRQLSEAERRAVLAELSAQVERLKRAGITPAHADSHHYIHTFLYLAPLVASVCREQGISRVRLDRTFDTSSRPRVTEGRIDNGWWRKQGFVTTAHFGRMSDIVPGQVPDDTEIMVHPDYDKNGVLIDRTGMKDGFPAGEPPARLL